MEEKLLNIMISLFGERVKSMNKEDITEKTIEEWDSINHLNLIVSLEEEFNISLDIEEIAGMETSFISVLSLLKKKVM